MTYGLDAWRHLGNCLRYERKGRSRAEVAEATKISVGTIEDYENGRVYRRPPDKMWRLANFYRWTPDSLHKVLRGENPTYLAGAGHKSSPPPPHDGIEEWIRDLIRNQQNLTTQEKTRKLRRFDDLLRTR